ncbi:MAG: potassium-transporting ATPase subunit KdpA [Pseudomonadota bacterium]|jgi:K+-transporting ATPase ATPase A chain
MNLYDNPWVALVTFLALLLALAWPLSRWCDAIFSGRLAERWSWLGRFESGWLRLLGSSADEDMGWARYALAIVLFNAIGLVALYALQRLQGVLPLNPTGMGAVSPDLALNTAVSFVTNTNWQGYAGETTMSHLTQMLGLAVQNFLSAATGIAVALALIRGLARHSAQGVGNAWLDLTRATLWVLLPLSVVLALFLVGQGVPQTLAGTQTATMQTLPLGPVASQEAIKLLGTNGGGFFSANSAHPFENPTALSNLFEMLAIFVIPVALVLLFGRWVGDERQGVALLSAMTVLFVALYAVGVVAQSEPNPLLAKLRLQGPSLEGLETRFGVVGSMLFVAVTTAASCGAVNAMHDSLMPMAGFVPMFLMQLGEVVFGGVGSGLYGMLLFALIAVFIAGLMVGRTPEYLGKKIGAFEMKMVAIAVIVIPALVLGGTALAVRAEPGLAGLLNPGAHGFSEALYALTSTANSNGSAFAGLSANTPFYNVLLAAAMWFGRFLVIVPVLALAGSLAAKPLVAMSPGTLPTHGPLFVVLLVGTVLMVGALNYVPALALGPVAEHLALFGIR